MKPSILYHITLYTIILLIIQSPVESKGNKKPTLNDIIPQMKSNPLFQQAAQLIMERFVNQITKDLEESLHVSVSSLPGEYCGPESDKALTNVIPDGVNRVKGDSIDTSHADWNINIIYTHRESTTIKNMKPSILYHITLYTIILLIIQSPVESKGNKKPTLNDIIPQMKSNPLFQQAAQLIMERFVNQITKDLEESLHVSVSSLPGEYCGPESDKALTNVIPDGWKIGNIEVLFGDICKIHDECYGKQLGKTRCDEQFLDNLLGRCQEKLTGKALEKCDVIANLYTAAVKGFGDGAYKTDL
eukprot:TRINITY_DN11130_c0_g1_i1.p1 TRINITY_DN11130_c0_g1~~TRINITY_DN11130_c0_g1_i1.p1  ORF type:complete len:341 (-),score=69.20 TRINITY_DN11130_c0_g1_i1:41-946(-)